MPIPVSDIVAAAAAKLGDPRYTLVTEANWLGHYNSSSKKMTREYRLIEQVANFSLAAGEDLYLWPDDDDPDDLTSPGIMVELSKVEYNETPSDPQTWTEVPELFTDEFGFETNRYAPTGDTDFRFFARANVLQITPIPVTTVLGGMRITYWRLQRKAALLATAMEMPGFCEDPLVDLMVIRAKVSKERIPQYRHEIEMWEHDMAQLAPMIEHRSTVRRRQIRPAADSGNYFSRHS